MYRSEVNGHGQQTRSEIKSQQAISEQVVVDLRSDTITKPTHEMRAAMMEAVVGDDVYEEDPTVSMLEKKAAGILGMENALFVASGTMGNLISIMVHCSKRDDEILVGDQSHISLYEQGNVATIGRVHPRTVRNLSDGTLDLQDLESKIRPSDIHFPCTQLICIENTQNQMGGRVLSLAYMKKLLELTAKKSIKLHIDGARIFNAAVALDVPVSSLVKGADSVSFCLSKGLGAPIGSIVGGSKDFIQKARRLRKALGGGMRQCGVIAAPALIALEKMPLKLKVDHDNAKHLAWGIARMKSLGLQIEPNTVETNILCFSVHHPKFTAFQFLEQLQKCENNGVQVRMLALDHSKLRAVTHHQVSKEDIDLCLHKMEQILKNAQS